MDKATVEAMLTRMFREMDPDVEYTMRHPDFQADMPQSGERFSSREKLREMQRAFPDPPTITLRRVVAGACNASSLLPTGMRHSFGSRLGKGDRHEQPPAGVGT